MGNSKSKNRRKRGESAIQYELRLKRAKSKKKKFKVLPMYRYNPIFGGSNFMGGGGPTIRELYAYSKIKYPKNLKLDACPTSILSGWKSRCAWRWMKNHECAKWVYRGDLLLTEAEYICKQYGIEHEDGEERIKLVYKKIAELKSNQNRNRNRMQVCRLLLLVWERRGQTVGTHTSGFSRLCSDRSILLRVLTCLEVKRLSHPAAS